MATTTAVYDAADDDEQKEQISHIEAPEDALVQWIQKEKKAANAHVQRWRINAKEAYRFVDGHQTSDADAKALSEKGRPNNAFNSAQKFIRLVTGIERVAPQALVFNALDESNVKQQIYGEFLTRCYEWGLAQSHGDFERSRAFYDLVVSGMGWEDYFIDRSRDTRGIPAATRLDNMEMWWPDVDRQNLANSRWRARESMVELEEAINRWPDDEDLLRASASGQETFEVWNPSTNKPTVYKIRDIETTGEEGPSKLTSRDEVQVLEWQWYDEELGYYFVDPIEEADVWLADKEFRAYRVQLMTKYATRITEYTRQVRRVHKKVFCLNGRFRLGEVIEIPGNRFTFNPMTGHFDQEDREWYGYMRILIDPQRYANKFFNQVIEVMGHQAKGGLLYEKGAIMPNQVSAINEDYTKPGTSQEVAPDAIASNRIKEKPLPQLPAASIAVLQFCITSMDTVTGISPEALFNGSVADTPGVTLRQKQQASLVLLSQEFDSLSRFRIEEGRIMFSLLSLIADERLIRIGGALDGSVIKFLQEPFGLEYDLALDDTERDPNVRKMYSEHVMALAPTLIRMNKFLPELLDYWQGPVKIRNLLKQAIKDSAKADAMAAQQGISRGGRAAPPSPEERAAKVQKIQADTALVAAKVARVQGQQKRDEIRTLLEGLFKAESLKLEKEKQQLEARKVVGGEKKSRLDFTGEIIKSAISSEAQYQVAKQRQNAPRPAAR